jgi:peptide/nickel transport system substrate-binding protein
MKFAYLILIIALVSSCGQINNSHDHTDKSIFKYTESDGISRLDPAYVTQFRDFLINEHLFNGLIALDGDMNVVPDIAKRWEVSDDGMEYTFYLREDVLFHPNECFTNENQRKVTSEDVVFSFTRVFNPDNASQGQYVFSNLDFSAKSNNKGVVAIDDFTLKIYLNTPQPSFLYQLSLPYGCVLPSEAIDKYGDEFNTNPVGTGPFIFKKWNLDTKLILVKNTEYFEFDEAGVRLPYLDAINVTMVKDKGNEFKKFQRGDYHMISGFGETQKHHLLNLSGEMKEEWKEQFFMVKQPWLSTDYLGVLVDDEINKTKSSPLQKKQVRQAVAYSLDVPTMLTHSRSGIGKAATTGFVPLGLPGYDQYAIEGYHYDVKKAKKLLSDAGYPEGKGAPVITLTVTPQYAVLAEFVQKSVSEIGLQLEVNVVSAAVFGQHIAQFEANFYRKSWIADFPDPINYLQLFNSDFFYPKKGLNYTHFKNDEFDRLYNLATAEDSTELRYSYYKQMQQIIHDEAPVIPLFYGESLRFFSNKVTGIESNAMNTMSLKRVKIEK